MSEVTEEQVRKAMLRSAYLIDVNGRQCSKCGEYKSWNHYGKNIKHSTERMTICKVCIGLRTDKNKNHKKEYDKLRVTQFKEILSAKKKIHYTNNKEAIRKKQEVYRINNKDKINEQKRKYREDNRDKINKQKRSIHSKDIRNTRRNYRRKNEPQFKIVDSLRCRLRHAIRAQNTIKYETTMKLLGCTIEYFLTHIEKQWQEGMSWDNHALDGWHLDHILPCDSFDLTKPEQQKQCFHYTNLQPLWALDNILKSNKIIEEE